MAARIAPLGWHVIMQDPNGIDFEAWNTVIDGLPCPVIIDHLVPPLTRAETRLLASAQKA